MECPDCGGDVLAYTVPEDLRAFVPETQPGAATCTVCLALQPLSDPPSTEPDFRRISDAFPASQAAALPMALALGLLSSLALHRSDIEQLFERAERAGTDPMLVVDRLAADPDVESHVDLGARYRQLEQLV